MTLKLSKFGNDYAIFLNDSQLAELKLDPLRPFELKVENGELILSQFSNKPSEEHNENFEEALTEIHIRFGNAMKRLAE